MNYSFSFAGSMTIAAAGSGNLEWNIQTREANCILKSIIWGHRIIQNGTSIPLNLNTQITQTYKFRYPYPQTGILRTLPVTDETGTGFINTNGNGIELYAPGQYFFNSIELTDLSRFRVEAINSDAILSYDHYFSFLIEIEKLKSYY